MYIDFEDSRPETPTLDRAMSRREAVILSIALHAVALLAILFVPEIPFVQQAILRAREAAVARQLAAEQQAQEDNRRFVFIQPHIDEPAPVPPLRAELSDQDRVARSMERPVDPVNPLPYSRGNTTERVEMRPEEERARGRGPSPEPSAARESAGEAAANRAEPANGGYSFGSGPRAVVTRPDEGEAGAARPGGALGEALRNLQRYTQNQVFDNPQGGVGSFGPWIQFDSKGVEFGPWIRRFVAQIKRNWFIPYAAMSLHGHVVLSFYVHKDGRITDLTIVKPSGVEAFTNAAHNALLASNPTQSLPSEYPADKALFTVTFFYNETPPSQ